MLELHHCTVLSNFARGFDKYRRVYSKAALPKRYPGQFYLLTEADLSIGLTKAQDLCTRLGVAGDRVVRLTTALPAGRVLPNLRNGLGCYVESDEIPVRRVALYDDGDWHDCPIEEVMAASLRVLSPELIPYAQLRPRTLSLLPIAQACQARCRFCFSEASISAEPRERRWSLAGLADWVELARAAGAERFVITGGGEPGLLPEPQLLDVIASGKPLGKVVMISNGIHLARQSAAERTATLGRYAAAGLGVLSISRHHAAAAGNAAIMGRDTGSERVLDTLRQLDGAGLQSRLICVLQRGGVDSLERMAEYLDFALEHGVGEICFKELYVSTTLESAYHAAAANTWSLTQQVPLSLVLDFCEREGFSRIAALPWGAPIFAGRWRGQAVRIAAYTEPSLFWERSHGIARSWNLMADGQCLVSLEDPGSVLALGEALSAPAEAQA